jgi:hypothetical protein
MPHASRFRALEDRHATIERLIAEEDRRPRPDEAELARLKREKLRLRDELERLKREDG